MKNLGFRKVLVNIASLNPAFKDIHIFTKKTGVKQQNSQEKYKEEQDKT